MVSIIIPLYNKADYIAETVESMISQKFTDWELIVVDNGSTDGGPEIVKRFDDKRIRLISCAKQGASAARNVGLSAASGDWVVFLDADDLLETDYLSSQLDSAVGVDLVICPYVEFTDGKDGTGKIKYPWHDCKTKQALCDTAIVYAPGPTHSFMIRRDILRSDLEWPEHLDRLLGEDAVYWFRLIYEARIGFNDLPVARYRFWTPESRFTLLSEPAKLFTGLKSAIDENLTYLSRIGEKPTAGQSENLMRFYSCLYFDSSRLRDRETQRMSLSEARSWQAIYFELSENPKISMRVRQFLGIPLFCRLFRHA